MYQYEKMENEQRRDILDISLIHLKTLGFGLCDKKVFMMVSPHCIPSFALGFFDFQNIMYHKCPMKMTKHQLDELTGIC